MFHTPSRPQSSADISDCPQSSADILDWHLLVPREPYGLVYLLLLHPGEQQTEGHLSIHAALARRFCIHDSSTTSEQWPRFPYGRFARPLAKSKCLNCQNADAQKGFLVEEFNLLRHLTEMESAREILLFVVSRVPCWSPQLDWHWCAQGAV